MDSMMRIADLPDHQRPREKLLELGPANLTDEELVALLLGSGFGKLNATALARRILQQYPLGGWHELSATELLTQKGLGPGKVCALLAAVELGQRLYQAVAGRHPTIRTAADAVGLLGDIAGQSKEHFVALYLNARHQLVHREVVSVGTIDASLVHPREVFAPALRELAVSIILAHNHPSGELTPSLEDRRLTVRLAEAGELMGIKVLDHLILAKQGWISLQETGYFRPGTAV